MTTARPCSPLLSFTHGLPALAVTALQYRVEKLVRMTTTVITFNNTILNNRYNASLDLW